jgi:L-lactate dehydrogenase complex protein LldG
MTSRAEFLSRIRTEVGKTPGLFSARTAPRPSDPRAVTETIKRELAERWPQALQRFQTEFERVAGVFHRVASITAVPQVIAGIAREREVRRLVAWHADELGADLLDALTARGLEPFAMPPGALGGATERAELRRRIADAELGLTGVDLAIAETGTFVLRSGGGRPRSTSLLPACHIAVFDRTALIESLSQAGVFLELWNRGEAEAGIGAVTNFITGPSRTADIELTLTRGVHGPKEVHAIFVEQVIRG